MEKTNVAEITAKLEQREAELTMINSVQKALLAKKEMVEIYELIGEKLRELFDAQVTGIYTFDLNTSREQFQYLYEDGKRIYPESRPLNQIRMWLIKNAEVLVVNENADETIERITGDKHVAVPGTRLPKSLLFVPLLVDNKVTGCLSLQNLDRENAFTNSDVQLLNTLANSISIALENARLFNETEQRNAELAVINSVQQGLVAEMDMQGVYDLVGDKIREMFDAQVAAICTFDHENNVEYFKYLYEKGERFYPEPRPIDRIRQRLIKTRKMIWINENAAETFSTITGEAPKAIPGTVFPKSMLFVPLSVGETVQGYVSLQNLDREQAFNESDVQLLNTLANTMSVALENARLFNETEQRNAELAVINSVQQGLVAEMDMQGIYDLVGDKVRELFDAQVTMIAVFDHENHLEDFKYFFEDGERVFPVARRFNNLREQLIKQNQLLLINENVGSYITDAVPGTAFPKSMVFVPLVTKETVFGYVSLQNIDHEFAFNDYDVRLLGTLANSMSVALENARLFSETEQRNAELAVINSVQEGLVAEMDMQGIYDLVGDRIRDLFDAQVTAIVTFDLNKKMEEFRYLFEDGSRLFPSKRPYDKVREKIIDDRKTLLFNENAAEKLSGINGEPHKPVPETRAAQSALYVPLLLGNNVQGYVSLQNLDRDHAFNESDVRLLSTLANSMSVALENARLFNESEQRNAELAVINSVQDGLVREMDMAAIYKLVGEKICDVLNTQTMIIRTFNHETNMEQWEYAVEKGERIDVAPRPFIWANKILIETRKHLLINEEYEKLAMMHDGTSITKGLAPKSAIFVPMIVGDVVIGSVSLQNVEKENAFNESDLQLITTLTNSMSVAIENARLFDETARLLDETEQRASEMQTVNNISRALVSQLELNKLIELVGEQMRETFKADIVYLALHNRKTNMLNFPYYFGDEPQSRPFGNGITEKIILKKEPLLINQNLDDAYNKLKAEKKGETVESYLGVPILAGSEAIGVISVQSKEQENRFNENDLRLLTTIAANVGVAMQNAEAYQNLQEALTELKSAQDQLVQQEKLASLGQLTAGIAHEIKNPLNFVNNFSEVSIEMIDEVREELNKMSEDGGQKTEIPAILDDIEANLRKIHEHGTRADSIVKSMLMHSRGGTGKMEPTNLNAVMKEYVNLAFHGMRAGKNPINVDIQMDLDDSIGEIPMIAEDFSRVILNLVNNAFDAMRDKLTGDGGQKTVDRYHPQLFIRTKSETNGNSIEIEDNGPGIPDDIKDKILQPFFTTKKGTQGTGLGLSITNDIVKAHGGNIDVHSQPGQTLFTIKLNG